MLLIYTGNGKGKSSACIGQCIRAYGHKERVAYIQMMKSLTSTGEQIALSQILGSDFHVGGAGFFRHEDQRLEHELAANAALTWAYERLGYFMIVIDEAIYALNKGLINQETLTAFLDAAHEKTTHVVLSGRDSPTWLEERADLVTSMQEIKHPWQKGIKATRGIEF